MQDRGIVIGQKENGEDLTLGSFNDFIKDTLEKLFKKHGLGDKNVKVGALIIKEDFKENPKRDCSEDLKKELRKDGWF